MTTSLAQQLKKLQVPQTSLLLQDKHRRSLLFDPKDAAAIDRDTAHAIGLTGLEELELIDPVFAKYRATLFSESSKQLERSVCTVEVNQQLDKSIADFLRTLSPYFLLRPAHKALEWLIYRFHIHLYNVDEILACIFPFHESRIFVRAVQLFQLSDSGNKWHWLMPLQKPGIPLPKSTLINHCYKDLCFMKFICDLVPNYMEMKGSETVSQSLIGLYLVTILGALEYSKNVSEEMLNCLLPYILQGLKSSCVEYCAATYMILCQIAVRATLTQSVVNTLINKMAQNVLEDLTHEFCICTLVIFQHQEVTKMPKKLVSLIRKSPPVQEQLQIASESFQTARMVQPLLTSLIRKHFLRNKVKKTDEESTSLLISKIVSSISIDEQTIKNAVRTLFLMYIKKCKSTTSNKKLEVLKTVQKKCLSILGILERRYPETCDQAVESFLETCKPHHGIVLQNLLSANTQLPEHRLVKGTSTPLFLALNHPSEGRRKAAVQALVNSITKEEVQAESKFVRESVLQRLKDDSPKVVKAVLALDKLLFKILPRGSTDILFEVLEKSHSPKWSEVKDSILKLLCNDKEGILDVECVTAKVLPFLFPVETLKYLSIIMKSHLAKTHPFVTHLANDCKERLTKLVDNKEDCIKWADLLLFSLKRATGKVLVLQPLVEQLESAEASNVIAHYTSLVLLQQMVLLETDVKKQIQLTVLTFKTIKKLVPFLENVEDSAASLLAALHKSQFPVSLVLSNLLSIIRSLPKDDPELVNLKMDIFGFLSSKYDSDLASAFSVILDDFFEKQFQSTLATLTFLSSCWAEHLQEGVEQGKGHQLATLCAAENILSSCEDSVIHDFLQKKVSEILKLFLCLMSPNMEVRSAGLKCLLTISKRSAKSTLPLSSLVALTVERSDEIESDESQFPAIFSQWLKPALETRASETRASQKNSASIGVLRDWLHLCYQHDCPVHVQYGTLLVIQQCFGQVVLTEVLPLCELIMNIWEEVGLMEQLPYLVISECLSKWTPSSAPLLSEPNAKSVVLLKRILGSKIVNISGESLQQLALKMISRSLFEAIPSTEIQHDLFDLVLNLYIQSRDGVMGSLILRALQEMCSSAQFLVFHLQLPNRSVAGGDAIQTVKNIRKLRSSMNVPSQEGQVENLTSWKGQVWTKLSVLMEVVLSLKEEPESQHALLSPLFELLKFILECSTDGNNETLVEGQEEEGKEYLLQLILSCLQLVVSSPSFPSSSNEEKFQVDLVVQCVRLTRHAQTQSQAHMLLNVAGQLFPERVLHSVMSIFTFMGSSLLRKEDNFSFQVVVQTVDTIVPALLQAKVGTSQESDDYGIAAAVSRVFVDAVYDIPSQRRLPVFCRLVSALGAKHNLWLPLVQLVDVSIRKHLSSIEEKSTGSLPPAVQFAISLCEEFPPNVQVKTALKVVQFLSTLPNSKEEWMKLKSSPGDDLKLQGLLDMKNYSEQKFLHFKHSAVSLLCCILSSEAFLAKVVDLKPKHVSRMETGYKDLLECLLLYIQTVSVSQKDMSAFNPKLPKRFLNKLHDLLDKVTSLLPSVHFLNVVQSLGNHPLASVRRKALEMLNAKLLNQPKFFGEEDHATLLEMLKPLVKIARGRKRVQGSPKSQEQPEDRSLNQQTALITILLLAKLLGGTYPSSFGKALGSLSIFFQQQVPHVEQHAQLVSNIVLCLAELCSCLRAHALPHMSTFMPPLLILLENEDVLFRYNFLLVSSVTTVLRLVEHLSAFLSSYLPVLLMQVCYFSSQVKELHGSAGTTIPEDGTHKSLSVVEQRLNRICSHLSTDIPGRVLLPAVEQCYQKMMQEDRHKAIGALMSILKERISTFEKSDFSTHLPLLKSFFLTTLDFRNRHSKNLLPHVSDIEQQIIETMLTLVLKLSETSFRPFFYQLYEWATAEEDEVKDRLITFYRLTEIMAARLKSLFVLFANHFVKNAADVLNSNNLSKSENLPWGNAKKGQEKSCLLLRYILSTLHNCFLHDTQHTLVEEECFKSLSQPLVDQLENVLGGDEEYQERVTALLSPCLAQLAVAASDDSCWKPFQYQILLKTRHTNGKVRFAALKSLQELATKLGDDYVPLLPEAIPFLAELLEDESSEVEQQCQEVLSKMEQIVGEPLKKYF